MVNIDATGVGGGIPFHVIGRKYTEGTNSQPHVYNNTLVYLYIELKVRYGKNPYRKYTVKNVCLKMYTIIILI